MQKKKHLYFVIIILVFIISSGSALLSKKMEFESIDLDKLSRFNEERIAYQRVEKYTDLLVDDSYESLLVLKNKKAYLLFDGYDLKSAVMQKKFFMDVEKVYIEDAKLWENKINGKPDYIRIMYRRQEVLTNSNEEYVSTNFGVFYKTIRDKFVEQHVAKFRQLMSNKNESGMRIIYKPIETKLSDKTTIKTQKYFASAVAKSQDESIYYCEDADGDGITETFTVTRADGFHWGFSSGPNILFIYSNTDKEIENMIGKLANESIFGTVADEKNTMKTFPKQKDVIDLIESVTPMDNYFNN